MKGGGEKMLDKFIYAVLIIGVAIVGIILWEVFK